jgi:hypothetical protein
MAEWLKRQTRIRTFRLVNHFEWRNNLFRVAGASSNLAGVVFIHFFAGKICWPDLTSFHLLSEAYHPDSPIFTLRHLGSLYRCSHDTDISTSLINDLQGIQYMDGVRLRSLFTALTLGAVFLSVLLGL